MCGLAVLLSFYASAPGVAQELYPRPTSERVVPAIEEFELEGVGSAAAAGAGGWILLAIGTVVTVAGSVSERRGRRPLADLTVLAFCVCPLLAVHASSTVAVASLLRWLMVAGFLLMSAVWWSGGGTLTRRLLAATDDESTDPRAAPFFFYPALSLLVLVHAAMVLYVAAGAIAQAGIDSAIRPWLTHLIVLAVVASGAAALARVVLARQPARRHSQAWLSHGPPLALLLGLGPLVVAMLFAVSAAVRMHPIVGPDPASWFTQIGWTGSYVVPVVALAAGLVGHAIVMRSSGVAFSAALLFHVGATAGLMLVLPKLGRSLDAVAWIQVAQLNAIVAAVYAVVWHGIVRWEPRATAAEGAERLPRLLHTLVSLSAALVVLFVGSALMMLLVDPGQDSTITATAASAAGSMLGWLALGVAAVACYASRGGLRKATPVVNSMALFAGGSMIALTLANGTAGDWTPVHVWLLSALVATASPLIEQLIRHAGRLTATSGRWSVLMTVVTAVLAFRMLDNNPTGPPWTTATLFTLGGLMTAWGILRGQQRFGLYAAALFIAATNTWFIEMASGRVQDGVHFILVNITALAASCIAPAWIAGTQALRAADHPPSRPWWPLGLHRPATFFCVMVLLLLVGGHLVDDFGGGGPQATGTFTWIAIAATFASIVACGWDPRVRLLAARLYAIALVVAGQFLNHLDLEGDRMWWSLTCTLAAFILATSYFFSRRGEFLDSLRLLLPGYRQRSVTSRSVATQGTLIGFNSLLTICVVGLVFWQIPQLPLMSYRVTMAQSILASAIGLGLMARGRLESLLRMAALVVGVLFAVALAWAWLPPDYPVVWLHRGVLTGVALVAMGGLYGFGIVKLIRNENAWTRAAAGLVPLLVVLAAGSLLAVVGGEVAVFFADGKVPLEWPAIAAVAVALVASAGFAIAAATLPGRDPLGLSPKLKTGYVYAAEAVLGLLFAAHPGSNALAVLRLVRQLLDARRRGGCILRRRTQRVLSAKAGRCAVRAARSDRCPAAGSAGDGLLARSR